MTQALKLFEDLCKIIPNSSRLIYGKALVIDKLSEIEESNEKLLKSIQFYKKLFSKQVLKNSEHLLLQSIAGKRLIDRLQFLGKTREAIIYSKILIDLFPNNLQLHNDLGVNYLLSNDASSAKRCFQHVLHESLNDPVALVHYGLILKKIDKKINESIDYLKRGIDTMDIRVIDGRFFYHLGDALQRNNQNKEV